MPAQSANKSGDNISLWQKLKGKASFGNNHNVLQVGLGIIALFLIVFSLAPINGQFGLLSVLKDLSKLFAQTEPEYDATHGCLFLDVIQIDKLSKEADFIVEGKVSGITTRWGENKHMYSEATLNVSESIKKKTPEQIKISYIGGKIENLYEKAGCHPEFSEGEEVLVFLNKTKDKDTYQVAELFMGKYRAFGDKYKRGIPGEPSKRKDDLKKEIKEYMGAFNDKDEIQSEPSMVPTASNSPEAPQTPTEATESPVESSPSGQQSRLIIDIIKSFARFVIPDVQAYILKVPNSSWFPWSMPLNFRLHVNPYPSAGNGSFDGARQAMSVWSSSGAGISMSDGGFTNDIDGVDYKNTIVFSDPHNTLAGTDKVAGSFVNVDCNFKIVVNRREFCKIYDNDIVFAPGKNWSGDQIYKILLHELGHALGLEHSDSGDSVMYVDPFGWKPSLGGDDINAAKLVYPPEKVTISGRVYNATTGQGIAGVEINKSGLGCDHLGGSRVSDANGYYSFENIPKSLAFCLRIPNLPGPNLPSKSYECQMAGGKFEPDGCNNYGPANVDKDADNQYDFVFVNLSGKISTKGSTISNVEVNKPGLGCDMFGSVKTDSNGVFTFQNVPKGTHFCLRTPQIDTYDPADRTYECQIAGGKSDPDACNNSGSSNVDLEQDNSYNFWYSKKLPNLMIDGLKCCQENTPGYFFYGESAKYSASVRNQSSVSTPNKTAGFRMKVDKGNDGTWDREFVQNKPVQLGPEQRTIVEWDDPFRPYPSEWSFEYKFEICADIDGQFEEENENDNCKSQVFWFDDGDTRYMTEWLVYYEVVNGLGNLQTDMSNGRNTIQLNGVEYAKGIGAHSYSEFIIGTEGDGRFCSSVNFDIGIDDEVGSAGSVEFKVFESDAHTLVDADFVEQIYASGIMKGDSQTKHVRNLPVKKYRWLKFVVTDGGGRECK